MGLSYKYNYESEAKYLLKAWRTRLGISAQRAAKEFGVQRSSVITAFEAGKARPGLPLAFRIEDVTAGDVPARAWLQAGEQ